MWCRLFLIDKVVDFLDLDEDFSISIWDLFDVYLVCVCYCNMWSFICFDKVWLLFLNLCICLFCLYKLMGFFFIVNGSCLYFCVWGSLIVGIVKFMKWNS